MDCDLIVLYFMLITMIISFIVLTLSTGLLSVTITSTDSKHTYTLTLTHESLTDLGLDGSLTCH